ncbi:hypothetical protein [Listeria seeligeri]|uniref:hypothetical protein n=1 Tax=Listeria seeligeri TaxID=1640 RepID=UPI001888C5B5|nr:hypothetical protein [Listeria seeligeri]MBF2653973.1 hypothetical protein [Listeria seeligeri]
MRIFDSVMTKIIDNMPILGTFLLILITLIVICYKFLKHIIFEFKKTVDDFAKAVQNFKDRNK